MIPAPIPSDEPLRLQTLRGLEILDTPPEERFERLTRLARRLFGVSIALVSLVDADRQWFKSHPGLVATETPRDISFCGHAIAASDVLTVPDALLDARFHDNPLVTGPPGIRFYAGCPLSAPNGSKLGTLCLIDSEPRDFGEEDRALLRDLARMAEQEIAAAQLANMDELTQLSNRRGFQLLAQHALRMCARLGHPAAVLYFDLDGFKQVNDAFGHAEGDRALAGFASVLLKVFRNSDVIGRLGGDEFAVLMTNCAATDIAGVTQRLQTALDAYNREAARGYEIRFSVGSFVADGGRAANLGDLLAEADASMYDRKRLKS